MGHKSCFSGSRKGKRMASQRRSTGGGLATAAAGVVVVVGAALAWLVSVVLSVGVPVVVILLILKAFGVL